MPRKLSPAKPSAKTLRKLVDDLVREQDFVDYHEARRFSYRLHSLLLEIDAMATRGEPADAIELLETLLKGQEAILNRVDDSSGEIGDVMRGAVELWLQLAADLRKQEPKARNWVEVVLSFYHDNDFGIFDNLISHSVQLLSLDELRQMAWRFENDARRAAKKSKDAAWNSGVSRACLGLHGVGKALRDIELIEKATLITTPTPNPLQLSKIIQLAIEFKALDRADYWLRQPVWTKDTTRYQALSNALLKARGDTKQLKANLLQQFIDCPNEFTLSAYLEEANQTETREVIRRAEQLAKDHDDAHEAIDMLLVAGKVKLAADILIERETELAGTHFSTLLNWARTFDSADSTLAAILCYRHLLMDLLDRRHRKAYHHGAHYFHRLLDLDKQQPDYRQCENAQAFIAKLLKKHGRKYAFWKAADYPNTLD